MIYTPSFPLQLDDTYGFKNVDSTKELVYFHLKNLLLTNPGEKISDPRFGVGIRQYLFENFSPEITNDISISISIQISRHMSYINLVNLDVLSNEDENILSIIVSFNFKNSKVIESVTLNFGLNSGIILEEGNY